MPQVRYAGDNLLEPAWIDNIKRRMGEAGYENQNQLARAMGRAPSVLSGWLNRRRGVDTKDLKELCNTLDCSMGDLMADPAAPEVTGYTGFKLAAQRAITDLGAVVRLTDKMAAAEAVREQELRHQMARSQELEKRLAKLEGSAKDDLAPPTTTDILQNVQLLLEQVAAQQQATDARAKKTMGRLADDTQRLTRKRRGRGAGSSDTPPRSTTGESAD